MRHRKGLVALAVAFVVYALSGDEANAHLGESVVTGGVSEFGTIVGAALAIAGGAWLLGVRHRPSQRIRNPSPVATRRPREKKTGTRQSNGRGRKV